MKQIKSTLVFALVAGLLFNSCSDNNKSDSAVSTDDSIANALEKDTTPVSEAAGFKFTYTLANMPSPLLLLDEYAAANLTIDVALLNPTANAKNYQTTFKQAMNFGVYGIDLGYIVANDRAPEVLSYYNVTRKLASNLNMGETFDQFVERFQRNSENKDSLTRIIDEAYSATDAYLKSNERLEAAIEILTGSWIESQYIGVNALKDVPQTADNAKLFNRIWEQHFHLGNLIKAIEEFKNNKELQWVSTDLKALLEMYKEPAEASKIDKAYMTKLAAQLGNLRSKIVG